MVTQKPEKKQLIDCDKCKNTVKTEEQGEHKADIQKCLTCIVAAVNKLAAK